MKPNDAWILAYTKFRARKARSIVTAFIAGISLLLILGLAIAGTGLINAGQAVFRDPNRDRFFASESGYLANDSKVAKGTDEEYLASHPDSGMIAVFREHLSAGLSFAVNEIPLPENETTEYLETALIAEPSVFAAEAVDSSKFNYEAGQPIPVIIPADYVIRAESIPEDQMTLKELNEQLRGESGDYVGRVITLTTTKADYPVYNEEGDEVQIPVTDISRTKFEIVAVSPNVYSFVIPAEARDDNPGLSEVFNNGTVTFNSEFNTEAERNSFVESSQSNLIYSDPIYRSERLSPLQQFNYFIRLLQTAAKFIGGILGIVAIILVMTTVSRVVSDSKREIGVFRAIGAKRRHIWGIFLLFTSFLITLGYAFGLIMAVLINLGVSLKYGNEIFELMTSVGNDYSAQQPTFITLGLPFQQLMLVYLVTLSVGVIASCIPIWRASRVDPIKALRSE